MPPAFHQPDEPVARHILITGRVQGVFFRKELRNEANRWHVKGWCRNLPTGQVEAVLSGPLADIEKVIAWCRRGPELARVDSLEVSEVSATHIHRRFQIIPGGTQ